MKRIVLILFVVGVFATGAFAQSSIFDRCDVKMTGWVNLPADAPWGGETSMVAVDGKGSVIVVIRAGPYFRVLTTDGQFMKSWGDEGSFGMAHSVHFDNEGNVWASDPIDHAVHKFDLDGNLLRIVPKKLWDSV